MADIGQDAGPVAELQGAAMLLRIKVESIAESIEGRSVEGHLVLKRYKRARRVARRCMNRARALQSMAMQDARAMAALRGELRNLMRQCEWLEQAGGDLAADVAALKADLRSVGEAIEEWASDGDGQDGAD